MSIPTRFNPMGADDGSRYLINPIMLSSRTIDTSQPHDYVMWLEDASFASEVYQLFDCYDYSGLTIPRGNTLFMDIHFDRPLRLHAIEFTSMVYPNTYMLHIYNNKPWEELYSGEINMGASNKFIWKNYSSVSITDNIYIEISTHYSDDDVDLVGIKFKLTE